ncbi:hypothetical protein BH10ACT11_BH10ACT11_00880 [soil metagenome]
MLQAAIGSNRGTVERLGEDSLTGGGVGAEEVAAAAITLISERGIGAVTIDTVAVLAGVDSRTVSAHYPDSQALIEGAILLDEQRFNAEVEQRWVSQDSPTEQLLTLLRHLVLHYDWSVWIELWSLALREDRVRLLRHRIDKDYHRLFEAVIERGVASGDFRVDDAPRVAVALATLVDSLAVQATLGDPRVSPHFMLDTCVECASRLLDAQLSSPSLAAGGF